MRINIMLADEEIVKEDGVPFYLLEINENLPIPRAGEVITLNESVMKLADSKVSFVDEENEKISNVSFAVKNVEYFAAKNPDDSMFVEANILVTSINGKLRKVV